MVLVYLLPYFPGSVFASTYVSNLKNQRGNNKPKLTLYSCWNNSTILNHIVQHCGSNHLSGTFVASYNSSYFQWMIDVWFQNFTYTRDQCWIFTGLTFVFFGRE